MVFVFFAISDIYLIPHKICHFKTVDFFREAVTSKQHTLGPVNRGCWQRWKPSQSSGGQVGGGVDIFHVFHFGKIMIKETGKERERVQLCLGLSQELGLAIPALRRLNKAPSDLQI